MVSLIIYSSWMFYYCFVYARMFKEAARVTREMKDVFDYKSFRPKSITITHKITTAVKN